MGLEVMNLLALVSTLPLFPGFSLLCEGLSGPKNQAQRERERSDSECVRGRQYVSELFIKLLILLMKVQLAIKATPFLLNNRHKRYLQIKKNKKRERGAKTVSFKSGYFVVSIILISDC